MFDLERKRIPNPAGGLYCVMFPRNQASDTVYLWIICPNKK